MVSPIHSVRSRLRLSQYAECLSIHERRIAIHLHIVLEPKPNISITIANEEVTTAAKASAYRVHYNILAKPKPCIQ